MRPFVILISFEWIELTVRKYAARLENEIWLEWYRTGMPKAKRDTIDDEIQFIYACVVYAYGLMGGAWTWTATLKREYTLESDAIISWIIRCLIASKWQYFSFRCFGFRRVLRSVRKLFFPYTFAYFIICIISPSGHYMNNVSWCRCCLKDIRIGRSCNMEKW